MSGFVNLDREVIDSFAGKEIEYYALWNLSQDKFFAGRSLIHGTYKDYRGEVKVYSDIIWGEDLDQSFLRTEFEIFCFDNDQPIYLGPPPFEIHRVDFKNEFGVKQTKYVPAESETDLALTIATFTNCYTTTRVNLDLTIYHHNHNAGNS